MAESGSTVSVAGTTTYGNRAPPADRVLHEQYPGGKAEGITRQDARPSLIKDQNKLFDVLKGWWKADATHSAAWRIEAREMYDFRAGDQWKPEDRQILNAQSRPDIVFNRVLTMLKAVAGMEINGRHEVHYVPRHNENTAVNELLTGAGKWMTDQCDAEDEESAAFEDCLTCGIGVTEHRLDYELDHRGIYVEDRFDPLEFYWDRNACKKNLIDSRRQWRAKKVPLADAMNMFRGKNRNQLDATWAIGTELDQTAKTIEEKRKREENTTDTTYDDMYEVTIVNVQWWEREGYWMMADPSNPEALELTDDEYAQFSAVLKQRQMPIQFMAVEMARRVFKEAYLGGEVLSLGDAALGRFKWTAITGEYNRSKGSWFGLVKTMKDPQEWANKWLSQSLHILNSTAKGGIMAEADAFEDVREAEDKWSRPDSIVWTKRGALSGQNPKVQARPGGAFPQGHIDLMQFAISAIRDVTGINLELLGLKDANQPGILEAQRKQAGMTVLATVFDSLRRFRKMGGRIRLHIIQNYLSDGRLIRIVGPEGAQAVPLLKQHTTGDYDVVIDDAPTSPNMKEANWAVIASLLPAFKDQLSQNPEVLISILEFSPLPAKLIEGMKQMMQKAAPQRDQQQNMAAAALTAKTNKDQAQAELFLSQAKKEEQTALYDIAIAMHQFTKAKQDSDLSAAKAAHERVKAAVAAMTPIDQPEDSQAGQMHEHAMAARQEQHESTQNVGQRRHELILELLKQQGKAQENAAKERQMAAQQSHERWMAQNTQAFDATQANQDRQHESGLAMQKQIGDASIAGAKLGQTAAQDSAKHSHERSMGEMKGEQGLQQTAQKGRSALDLQGLKQYGDQALLGQQQQGDQQLAKQQQLWAERLAKLQPKTPGVG